MFERERGEGGGGGMKAGRSVSTCDYTQGTELHHGCLRLKDKANDH